ncbi:MAG: CocE/NonD family hydrolase [Chloroflexota bacterium]
MSFKHKNIHIKDKFPNQIRVIENESIYMQDGTRLAAKIWLPVDAEQHPVPALLEYLPYRKNDWTAWRDSIRHPYLAGHGYAAVRVDMRGNGDSDGVMLDEYAPQELADALEVLAWLEAQPWCTGHVGIFGKSWGGFNGLQIAALRPPQLKAIITIASTDDRYADDVHYMGGCLLGSEMLPWASTMLAFNASPPDPRFVGEKWREMWLERLEKTPPFVEAWVAHQRRDAYWQHGSVCENYADIECAVYVVGSYADGYTNAVPRLLDGLSCPKKGLLGPWAHNFPENSSPEPSIGFLQESLRWWDYWLKGKETGIMDEPLLRSWIQDSFGPGATRLVSEGRWVVDGAWPSPNVDSKRLTVSSKQLGRDVLRSRQWVGMDGPRWLTFGGTADFALEQGGDNGRSLCFETAVQPAADILGQPQVELTLQVDQPQASLAVRLCDVDPEGTATLVTWGLYNLTHREGHEVGTAVPVNQPLTVTVPLNIRGHRLKAGHRWLVAVSPTYWPHLWPAPHDVVLTIEQCDLILPVRTAHKGDDTVAPFAEPEVAPPLEMMQLTEGSMSRFWSLDPQSKLAKLVQEEDSGRVRLPDGLEMVETTSDIFTVEEGDPLSARVVCERFRDFRRGDWQVDITTYSSMSCDADTFYLVNRVVTREGTAVVFDKTWEKQIPRDFQ